MCLPSSCVTRGVCEVPIYCWVERERAMRNICKGTSNIGHRYDRCAVTTIQTALLHIELSTFVNVCVHVSTVVVLSSQLC